MGSERGDGAASAGSGRGASQPARLSGAPLAANQLPPLTWPELRDAITGDAPPPRIAEELPRHELDAIPNVTRLQAQLLANRGVRGREAALDFLRADWRTTTGELPGQRAAVARLQTALAQRERIIVYGDHDCDGMTSCALFLLALRALDADATPYVPLREDDGRGLNELAVRKLAAEGARLIITTDCGSANVAEVALARSLGVDVIITDHHPILGETPHDCVIVNPRLAEPPGLSGDLAGAGVAFRLAEALLCAVGPERAEEVSAGLLDLVAVGTIGDIAPMTRENWALTHAGLERIRSGARPGLRALLALASVVPGALSERDVTFAIAPRLNAAARLGQPLVAVELLLATNHAEAQRLAAHLDALNQERQRITEEIVSEAQSQVEAQRAAGEGLGPLVSAVGAGWPLGMLGLVASRLTDHYQRPAVVISEDGGEARGSARAPEGVNLGETLAERAEVFRRFGGHARAAGFTLASADVPALLDYLRQRLGESSQGADQPAGADGAAGSASGAMRVDCRLPLSLLVSRIYREQQALAPYGPGYPEPVYICQSARIFSCWRSGAEGRNLRLRARDAKGEGVFFWARRGDLCESLRAHLNQLPTLDIIYSLDAYTRATGELDLLPRIIAVRLLSDD